MSEKSGKDAEHNPPNPLDLAEQRWWVAFLAKLNARSPDTSGEPEKSASRPVVRTRSSQGAGSALGSKVLGVALAGQLGTFGQCLEFGFGYYDFFNFYS